MESKPIPVRARLAARADAPPRPAPAPRAPEPTMACPLCGGRDEPCDACGGARVLTEAEARRLVKEEAREVGSLQLELGQRARRCAAWRKAVAEAFPPAPR